MHKRGGIHFEQELTEATKGKLSVASVYSVQEACPTALRRPTRDPMETSLHRALKDHYAADADSCEVPVGPYRVDAVSGGRLIEIQHGALAAIRDKVANLLAEYRVVVVKPIVARKTLVKQSCRGGEVVGRRLSPKRGRPIDLFADLVHFLNVFPHRRLTLEVPLVEIEEYRYPGHGRRRRWRANDYQVEDQRLVSVGDVLRFRRAADLAALVACPLPQEFHTADLAAGLGIGRWEAQRIAYCLRRTGVFRPVGKRGNALLYRWPKRLRPAA